jgi:general secretion pathway protein G
MKNVGKPFTISEDSIMSRRRIRRSSRAAFTLMEVLLVLVILVVLGSLAVGMFTGAQKKANTDAAQAQVDSISQQCLLYNQDMNAFPPSLDALRVAPGGVNNANQWSGPYLDRDVPLDPWGNPYQYQFPGSRHPDKPDIWSWGPDMQNGTDDDIYNR